MQYTARHLLLALASTALAAPIDNGRRQLGGESGVPFVSGISAPTLSGVALPTGGLGSSSGSGLGGLGSSSGGLGSGGTGSSTGGLGSLPSLSASGGGLGSATGGLGSLPSSGASGGGLGSSTGGLGSLPSSGASSGGLGSSIGSGLGSTSSGIAGLGSSSSGMSGIDEDSTELTPTTTLKEKRQSLAGAGSLGSGSSGIGSLGSGTSGLGHVESGSSGLGSLGSGTSGLGSLGAGSSSLGSSIGSTGFSSGSTSSSSSSADSGGCKALTFIFARGTGEAGTMGTVVGPPVATALANKLGADKVTSEGVDYPADAGGNANLGASGGPAMAKMAQSVLSSCPGSKVVLGGYSQGGMVVHNALSSQGLDGSKIAAVVAFGDPLQSQGFKGVDKSKVKEFCGSGDSVCNAGGSDESGSHLDYGKDANAAAAFIASATGLAA